MWQAWRRRHWRADPTRLAAFVGLKPIVVVTGGSDGIGRALASRFAAAGDEVLIIGRDTARLSEAAAAMASGGRAIHTLALDVTAATATAELDARLAALGGYCDVLVNSAGMGLAGDFGMLDAAALDRLTSLNVAALTRLTRHVLPDMLLRGRGGVLNLSSLGGYAPGPWQAAYYASKAYALSLSEAVAHEVAGHGVTITAVCPGPVETQFHARMRGETGLYLRLMPVLTAEAVARSAHRGFRSGRRVIVPGVVAKLMMPAMRILPHGLLLPVVALLLKPR